MGNMWDKETDCDNTIKNRLFIQGLTENLIGSIVTVIIYHHITVLCKKKRKKEILTIYFTLSLCLSSTKWYFHKSHECSDVCLLSPETKIIKVSCIPYMNTPPVCALINWEDGEVLFLLQRGQ